MFVVCTLLLGFQLVFNQSFLIIKKKKKKKGKRRKAKKIVAAEGAKAIARFVLPRENPESHTKTNAEGYMDSWT